MQAGILKTVIHNDHFRSGGRSRLCCGKTVRIDNRRCLSGQQQRFVADLLRCMVLRVDQNVMQVAAITAGNKKWFAICLLHEFGKETAVGVFPVPPAVRLPIQTTGTAAFLGLCRLMFRRVPKL